MPVTIPDKSLLQQHEIAQKPIDGLAVISPAFSFLLHQSDYSNRYSFKHIPGFAQKTDLDLHTLQSGGKRLLVSIASDTRDVLHATLPIRIAHRLGVGRCFFYGPAKTPDAGKTGFVLIRDHINLLGKNPLIGPNPEEFGTRFPDMTDIYQEKIRQLLAPALKTGNRVEGILVAHPEPEKLSAAEKEALQKVGTCYFSEHLVPEAIVARHGKMQFGTIVCAHDNKAKETFSEPEITRIFQRTAELLF